MRLRSCVLLLGSVFIATGCLARSGGAPSPQNADRDQAATVKAREALEELIRLYPTSEYAEKARAELAIVIDRLAEHEFVVGRFYQRYGVPGATVARIEGLLKNFPGYSGTDAALYYLGLAYIDLARPEDAATTFARLREEHPESRYVRKASKQG